MIVAILGAVGDVAWTATTASQAFARLKGTDKIGVKVVKVR